MSSHNKHHTNNPIIFLSKETITDWILYATLNQPTQVLVYGTGSLGELLLTAILATDEGSSILVPKTGLAVIAKQSVYLTITHLQSGAK